MILYGEKKCDAGGNAESPVSLYLPELLQALAGQEGIRDGIGRLEVLTLFSAVKQRLGYTEGDTLQCLRLAEEKGILLTEGSGLQQKVRFASEDTEDYYYSADLITGVSAFVKD